MPLFALALFASGAALAAISIRHTEVDNEATRAADEHANQRSASPWRLLAQQAVLIFVLSIWVEQLANPIRKVLMEMSSIRTKNVCFSDRLHSLRRNVDPAVTSWKQGVRALA
jgi:hypothetical protein